MSFLRAAKLGYFGKTPTTGDFVARNIGRPARDLLDQWFQAGLLQSRKDLGDDWLHAYLTSPIWRFIISADGIPGCLFGIMIPSVDKAGRYFPFAIVAESALPTSSAEVRLLEQFIDSLETLILSVLEEDFDLDHFGYQLANMARGIARSAPDNEGGAGAPVTIANILDSAEPSALQHLQTYAASTWWTSGSELKRPDRFDVRGMPSPTTFSRMLRDPDIFAEYELLWRHLRDLAPTQQDNGSIEINRVLDGVAIHGVSHAGSSRGKNHAYAQLLTSPAGIIITDGRVDSTQNAMVARFVCAIVPELFLKRAPEEIRGEFERVAAFLRGKISADHANILAPLSFALVQFSPQTGNFTVSIAGEYLCLTIGHEGVAQLLPVEPHLDKMKTVIKATREKHYVSLEIRLAEMETLIVGNASFLNPGLTAGVKSSIVPGADPYHQIHGALELALLHGNMPNLALGAISAQVQGRSSNSI